VVRYNVKPWFLRTTQWRLRTRDATCRSQSSGFQGDWFLKATLMYVAPGRCAGAAASCSCGIRTLISAWWRKSLVTTSRQSGVCSRRMYFLCTMSCKQEFYEKLIDCLLSFPVIYDPSKKSYEDRIAKDNAWKRIATALERDGRWKMDKIICRNMLSWLELLISRYCCIYLVVYIIYISLYFFGTCYTISIYSSTECRVFHNVTFFGS